MYSTDFGSRRTIGTCGILVLLICALAGCSQRQYRIRADKEVKYLVTQKSNDPRWDLSNFTIGMDPRARFFDPTDPDGPPMPYDDPASHRYMHCVAGKKGYPCWHMYGDWYDLENPRWKELLTQYNEVGEDGAIKLTMNGSVCLAQVHLPDYRTQIEQIYLSALDVSAERYRFDVQFFGDSSTVFSHTGKLKSPIGEQNTLTYGAVGPDSTYRLAKHFATGADLLVGFANSFVWQFAGPDTNVTTSLLNFSLVQPLLRSGGRVFALETLTIAERVLLGNLRAFQRYRQGFYTTITVGNSFVGPVQGPQRRGGFFGGTGITGFTGQGAGGIGGVASGQFGIAAGGAGGGGGGGGGIGFVSGSAGSVGGFVGLLQLLQSVRNAESNLNVSVRTVGLLEANLDAGLIDIVQVDSFRQQIESNRANLLSAQIAYETQLDSFKTVNLGLPPDVAVKIDDSMLSQFQFLDPKTTAVQHMFDDFINEVGLLPMEPSEPDLRKAVEVLATLRQRLADQFRMAQDDMQVLEAKVSDRKRTMPAKQASQFDADRKRLSESLADVETRFQQTEGVVTNLEHSVTAEGRGKLADEIVAAATGLSGLNQELLLVKARARLESVTIPSIQLPADHALEIARAHRLDWMNNRASLVDTWRLISWNANQLKAGLDLTFSGDMGTVGNNPAAFNGQNGSLRVGLRFDAPFTRRLERNNYRNALITYQQQRRQLYQYQDGVNFTLRNLIRTLNQLETNLEIQRRAVVIAIRRVDKTREDLSKPPAPTKATQPGQLAEPVETLGPTVAQNLIQALNDLQNVQNVFISVVLNHYENRMLLYRELGIMELDDCGMWIDKPLVEADWLSEEQSPLPPAVPVEWMQEAGVDPKELHEVAVESEKESNAVDFDRLASPAALDASARGIDDARYDVRSRDKASAAGTKAARLAVPRRGQSDTRLPEPAPKQPRRQRAPAEDDDGQPALLIPSETASRLRLSGATAAEPIDEAPSERLEPREPVFRR